MNPEKMCGIHSDYNNNPAEFSWIATLYRRKSFLSKADYHMKIFQIILVNYNNKPDRAKMRPDCVSACIDHERQMDEQTGETSE